MSSSIGRMVTFATLAAFAGTGLMQAGQQASFHLPVEAHWGKVVLQPGDYKMSLPDLSIGERTVRLEGDHNTVNELPLVTDVQKSSNKSEIELLRVDGTYFVREFSYGPTGKTFIFSVPKAARQQLAELRKVNASVSSSN